MGRQAIDLCNTKFGDVTALHPSGETRNGSIMWTCLCACGGTFSASTSCLRRGRFTKCPDCRDRHSKAAPIRGLYYNYRRNARKNGRDFEITFEDFSVLISKPCEYCTLPPSQLYNKGDAKYSVVSSGIDRRDNAVGYTLDNAVPCCRFCNFAKGRFPVEELKQWILHIQSSNHTRESSLA